MLKGLDPILSSDLLWVLAAMGHGDDLALVDGNHPAERIARHTASGRMVHLPGLVMARVARAVLSVFPLDDLVPDPARRTEVVDDPTAIPAVQRDVQAEIDRVALRPTRLVGLERFSFYEQAKAGFAVVQVGDPSPYGCFLLHKGVITAQGA